MSLKMSFVQYAYFVINFVFVIVGTLLMTIASAIGWVPGEFGIFMDLTGELIRVLNRVGISLIVLSLIANVASVRQSFMLISMHGGLVLTLSIVEINLAINAFIAYDTCNSVIARKMLATLENYYYSTKPNWDYMQHYLYCCGVNNSSDWAPYQVDGPEIIEDGHNYTIPYSCCADLHCYNIHSTGCLSIVSHYFSEASLIVFCIVISIAIVKVWVLIFSCTLIFTGKGVEFDGELREPQKSRDMLLEQPNNHDWNAPSSSVA